MNSNQDTDARTDHLRYEISQLEKMREQILSDMEALRQQETNLRAFEARLRGTIPPQGAVTRAPMDARAGAGALDAEWEKFQRSRALLEAERRALTDDRIALREEREVMQLREEELRKREAWVESREKELAAQAMSAPVVKASSRTPFELARNFFTLRRAS
jgi:chromosome segregation ATPase